VAVLIFIIIVLVLAVLGVSLVALNGQRGPGRTILKPGPNNPQLTDPAQIPLAPGEPGFQVKSDPGFNIVSRTGGQPGSPPQATGVKKTARTSKGLGDVTVTQNLTAICRLTGKRVTDCTCTRCSAIRKRKAL
jgi:hypothetical protein